MRFKIKYIDEANVLSQPDGPGLISREFQSFVIRKLMPKKDLEILFDKFVIETSEFLTKVFVMKPQELGEWHGNQKVIPKEETCPFDACIGFKGQSVGGNRLSYLNHTQVLIAANSLGVIKDHEVSKFATQWRLKKNCGSLFDRCQSWEYETQKAVIEKALSPNIKNLSHVLQGTIQQGSNFDFQVIKKMLDASENSDVFYLKLFSTFEKDYISNRRANNFAITAFSFYLAGHGVCFFPRLDQRKVAGIFPRIIRPIWWCLITPMKHQAICNRIREKDLRLEVEDVLPIHIRFLIYSNAYEEINEINPFLLLQLKAIETSRIKSDRLGYSFNRYFEHLLFAHQRTKDEFSNIAAFYGGGSRANVSLLGFDWVEGRGDFKTKIKIDNVLYDYEKLLKLHDQKVPQLIRDWAKELRELIPHFLSKQKAKLAVELNYWLVFLLTFKGGNIPKNLRDVSRENLFPLVDGTWCYRTFLENCNSGSANITARALVTLRQAWLISANLNNISLACPITPEDIPKGFENRNGRTRRKALPLPVLEFLAEVNRAQDTSGLPFAFARHLKHLKNGTSLYNRRVVDHHSGKTHDMFWPALPIIMDMIFTTGMRSKSALYMDSGEGDEYWVDIAQKCEIPNPLDIANRGQKNGFLRLIPIGPAETVLGMFLPINKTGSYEVPWVDMKTAEYFQYMRDWQIRYNPVKLPISSIRSSFDKEMIYKANGDLQEVFPVFRDPASKAIGHPPSSASLYAYWEALLRYCEPIYNERQKKIAGEKDLEWVWEPFLINGKPRWDVHSLRVTTVTTLIDAGVAPHIIAELVGHKSLAMTWHYVAVNSRVTHEQILKGLEERRQKAIEEVAECKTEDEIEHILAELLGGNFHNRGDEYVGDEFLKQCTMSGIPRSYEVYSHGICPGGDCAKGGERYGGKYQPVFRAQACSRCRFRVTGPAFLNGLVFRVNLLLMEINESMERERALNEEIDRLEDGGCNVDHLRASLERHIELREELWEEWAAEMALVRSCQQVIENSRDSNNLPIVTGLSEVEFKARLETVHSFELLHKLVSESQLIAGASIEIPDSLRAQRDEILLDIASKNDAVGFFYSLSIEDRKRALDAFGEVLIAHTHSLCGDPGEHLQSIIQGELAMPFTGKLKATGAYLKENNTMTGDN